MEALEVEEGAVEGGLASVVLLNLGVGDEASVMAGLKNGERFLVAGERLVHEREFFGEASDTEVGFGDFGRETEFGGVEIPEGGVLGFAGGASSGAEFSGEVEFPRELGGGAEGLEVVGTEVDFLTASFLKAEGEVELWINGRACGLIDGSSFLQAGGNGDEGGVVFESGFDVAGEGGAAVVFPPVLFDGSVGPVGGVGPICFLKDFTRLGAGFEGGASGEEEGDS